ncbi:meprin A subunit beta-like, partial [Boleophthalmus pectinirostris]|uniref:meprin A subunit beta-like n=1 Tax=Boleophthalmus pectinirostris TaxID=150288 RepID=UPI002432A2BB
FPDIGGDKDITEINKDLEDDILVPKGLQRSSVNSPSKLWSLPVPYILDSSLELNAKGVIMQAMDQFRLKSCIDFSIWNDEKYYISVQKLGGCYSYVGRTFFNGQDLSIGTYCDSKAVVEHEFLHALGFYHEQSRYDRDEHVTIQFQNIIEGYETNFEKQSEKYTTSHGVPYDYMSVMHYGPFAFSNGNGSTITTKDPAFQDIIGQRLEMSSSDVKELNLLYKCNSTIAFKMHCSFSDGSTCQMSGCSQSSKGWENVTSAPGGPATDHTNLMDHSKMEDKIPSSFMHASTAFGVEGESAWLETSRMTPNRSCHVQCLQFYYFHSGHESDQLNIWIREFQDENDFTGQSRMIGQITGNKTSYWKYHHVSISATKSFQVEFEVQKGAGSSTGGFSIDDINLSELTCPHVAIQVDDFENVLKSSDYSSLIFSKTQYTEDGYAFRVATILYRSYFGLLIQLVEGKNDDKLQWPLLNRQVTFQMIDQNPNIQLQMSKQRSMTSDINQNITDGVNVWDNPRKVGSSTVDENGQKIYAGPLIGRTYFATLEDIKMRGFLKGGSAVFAFTFQDITPLIDGSSLPCSPPPKVTQPPKTEEREPCSSRLKSTLPPTTTSATTTTTTVTTASPETTTEDKSIFGLAPRFCVFNLPDYLVNCLTCATLKWIVAHHLDKLDKCKELHESTDFRYDVILRHSFGGIHKLRQIHKYRHVVDQQGAAAGTPNI